MIKAMTYNKNPQRELVFSTIGTFLLCGGIFGYLFSVEQLFFLSRDLMSLLGVVLLLVDCKLKPNHKGIQVLTYRCWSGTSLKKWQGLCIMLIFFTWIALLFWGVSFVHQHQAAQVNTLQSGLEIVGVVSRKEPIKLGDDGFKIQVTLKNTNEKVTLRTNLEAYKQISAGQAINVLKSSEKNQEFYMLKNGNFSYRQLHEIVMYLMLFTFLYPLWFLLKEYLV